MNAENFLAVGGRGENDSYLCAACLLPLHRSFSQDGVWNCIYFSFDRFA